MLQFNDFYAAIAKNQLAPWLQVLPAQLAQWQKDALHGDFKQWQKVLANLPVSTGSYAKLDTEVSLGLPDEL